MCDKARRTSLVHLDLILLLLLVVIDGHQQVLVGDGQIVHVRAWLVGDREVIPPVILPQGLHESQVGAEQETQPCRARARG